MKQTAPVWQNEAVHLKTGCKINLFLNICRLRADGYHELQTLFYPLSEPFDNIYVRPLELAGQGGLVLDCPALPGLKNERTTLHKALEAFNKATGRDDSYEVWLDKQVPAGAGLGGGSANAAGFLRYLNTRSGVPVLSEEKLLGVAAKVGADVPFFLMDGPALAEGIGEKLSLKDISLSGFFLVLVCPGIHVSTPWAYKEWDRLTEAGENWENSLHTYFYQLLTSREGTATKPASDSKESCAFCWPWFYNNLEQAVFPAHPEIAAIKEELFRAGARAALMSGSGSSVFGLFDSLEKAQIAANLSVFKGFHALVQALKI